MTAPAGFQQGSWRGLPFVVETAEEAGGRRGQQHEFTQGEKPVWEDLGGKAQRFTIDCHIIGEGFLERALAFRNALRAPGVGTLVHPWYGSMQVAVGDFSRRDSATDDAGYTVFSVEFLESGLPAVPAPAIDTASLAVAAADATDLAAPAAFASATRVEKVQAFIEEHLGELVEKAGAVLSTASALQGGIGPGLLAITANLGVLPANVQAQLRDPLALGATMLTAVQSIRVVSEGGISLVTSLIGLLGFGEDLPPIPGETPAREIQRANQAAFVQLVNLATAGELARAIAETSFGAYDEAVSARDAAADALDALALRQADAGDDAGAAAYDALRRAIVRDVTARGGSLARLQDYLPAVTEPALAIAQRLYGDPATIEQRVDEIVARNRIAHPGFVPGGRAIQVLTPVGAANG